MIKQINILKNKENGEIFAAQFYSFTTKIPERCFGIFLRQKGTACAMPFDFLLLFLMRCFCCDKFDNIVKRTGDLLHGQLYRYAHNRC